jgi:CoA:oxalate CoA-transferase
MTGTAGALSGVRVVECTHVLNGPYGGRLLAELDAEVIKVEPPNGEFYRRVPIHNMNGESGAFIYFNANKKCVTLNLRHQKGREILLSLASKADVFLENFAPGTMERLGLGYEDIQKVNPEIIYASSTGFGLTGPYKNRPAMDLIVQAMCGLVDITGFADTPVAVGTFITDYVAGMYTALAVISALYHREKTGKGQRIDIGMFDAGVSLCTQKMLYYLEGLGKRGGNSSAVVVPYDIYPARDGNVVILSASDEHWRKLEATIKGSDTAPDQKLRTNSDRTRKREEVDNMVAAWTKERSAKEILDLLDSAGIPCGPVQLLESLLDDPQAKARELFVEVDHPVLKKVKIPGSVFKMSRTPGLVRSPGQPLGHDNYEVYHNLLGYSREEITKLAEERII